MICKVIDTIDKHELFKGIGSIAVGVSGGADSMCLLNILNKLKDKYGFSLRAVHLNHNIRGDEAKRDEDFVRQYCEKIGVEILVFSEDIPERSRKMGISEEECGRQVRYRSFSQAQCDAVATAHTLSDSIETAIFNLIRGTGTKGLAGIPVKREPNIIRPLIDCTRQEIEQYCKENEIPYVTDSTNLSDDYTRNYIRHNIISLFKKVNEGYQSSIASAISILREENAFIEKCAKELIDRAKTEKGYIFDEFYSADAAVRKRAIALIIKDKMTKNAERRHIELIDSAISSDGGKIELSKDLYILVNSDIITFHSRKNLPDFWACDMKDGSFSTPYGVFLVKEVKGDSFDFKNSIDTDKVKGKLTMTARKEGDCFFSKKRGNTKNLKKLFNEDKIPEEMRGKIAVLRDGENLVWLEGYGTDGKYLPDENTKRITVITKPIKE